MDKVESFLQKVLWEQTEMQVMRLKGLVSLGDKQVIIQGVHDTYDTYERPTRDGDSIQGCTFVLIGRNLDKESLIRTLSQSLGEN